MILYKQSKRRCIILRAFCTFLIGCAVLLFLQDERAEAAQISREDAKLRTDMPARSKRSPVHLYFADRNNYFLMSEQRVVVHPDDPAGFAHAVIQALIKGPQKGLLQTIPADTKLRAIYITPDNVCYVDLSEAVSKNHPGGSNSEMLTIYSIVNSLILNVSEINRVKILIDGNEAPTLAGHVNLQFPLKAHMLLIR